MREGDGGMSDLLTRIVMLKERVGGEMILVV